MLVGVPGDKTLDIIRSAMDSVMIVAPYIKSGAMSRILSEVPGDVKNICCVTRWLPEDIALGVSDLGIFDQISALNGELFVHPRLHAKYYRADERCLIGSANLTGRGLGWSSPSNVELLVEVPATFEGLREWEAALVGAAVSADALLRDRILEEANRLKEAGTVAGFPEVGLDEEEIRSTSFWVPLSPSPENVWAVYQGIDEDSMVTAAYQSAKEDLIALSPPSGLNHSLFINYIQVILRQMPLIAEIDQMSSHGLTDNQAYNFLVENVGDDLPYPVETTWRVLKDWLVYFFPETYRREADQEVLVKGTSLLGP